MHIKPDYPDLGSGSHLMPYSLIFVTVFVEWAFFGRMLRKPDNLVFIKVKIADRLSGLLINICILACLAAGHINLCYSPSSPPGRNSMTSSLGEYSLISSLSGSSAVLGITERTTAVISSYSSIMESCSA